MVKWVVAMPRMGITLRQSLKLISGWGAIAALLLSSDAIGADNGGEWLDAENIANWNTPNGQIPRPPAQTVPNVRLCPQPIREAQIPEDEAVVAAGWTLFGAIQIFGETTLINGLASVDRRCRAIGHQTFVFVNGEFAGTLSPSTMFFYTDGSLLSYDLSAADALLATYQRHSATESFCFFAVVGYLSFTIAEQAGSPVVVPEARAFLGSPSEVSEIGDRCLPINPQ